ncbi:hypothetical protein RHECNPAF_750018 [Rhizobium etli CNPAF512]|nr:hypothetical protein RHECNPAF_750018 [Rhizobium etli CNPAF512]
MRSNARRSESRLGLFEPLAVVGVEVHLAQANGLRRHLDQFVFLDPGERALERHADRRGELDGFVLAGGTDVGQLLALQHVDLKVVVARMDADDHAHIDLFAGVDDHRAAVFQVEQSVGHGFTGFVGEQHAVDAAADLALVGLVAVEQAVHDRRAARVGQQFRLVADQAAGRRIEHQTDAIATRRTKLDHFGLALRHLLYDDAGMLFVDVDEDFFDRLQELAALILVHDHAGTRYGKLEAFAAHVFDQNGKLKFAAAGDEETILVGAFFNLQRNVPFGLLEQAVADDAAGDLVAFGARQRRVVDDEGHGDRRRVDRLRFQRFRHRRITEGIGDRALGEAGDRDDVARMRLFDRLALDAAEGEDLGNAALFDQLTVLAENLDGLVRLDRTGRDAAGDDAAEEVVGLEDRADHAERTFLDLRLGHVLDDEVEQRRQAFVGRACRIVVHPAGAAGTVEDGEVELLVGRIERGEKVEHFVDHFVRAGVGTVDLVDGDDRAQADLEGLADDELGLRHRAFGGVHENDGAVHHRQDTLDFTAEVGVAGRVDDVDAGILPLDRGRLGENGDAALFFDVVGVHHAFHDALVLAERAGLFQKLVNESGLAMVNVRDDRDVAKCHMS